MNYLTTAALGAALITGSTALQAQPPRGILTLDSDGDGRVSREEFRLPDRRPAPKMLHDADVDGDGEISRDEVQSMLGDAPQERADRVLGQFDRMDADGNGVVSRQELTGHAFARLDSDGDGFVTEEEARTMHQRRRAMRENWGRDGEHGKHRRMQQGAGEAEPPGDDEG